MSRPMAFKSIVPGYFASFPFRYGFLSDALVENGGAIGSISPTYAYLLSPLTLIAIPRRGFLPCQIPLDCGGRILQIISACTLPGIPHWRNMAGSSIVFYCIALI